MGKTIPMQVHAGVGESGEQMCGKGLGGGRQQVECGPLVCLGNEEGEQNHGCPGPRHRSTASRWRELTILFSQHSLDHI